MSVYIKGMEMPASCCNCLLAKLSPTGESLFCNYTLSTVPWDERPFDCPLIPVPDHGDLIARRTMIDYWLGTSWDRPRLDMNKEEDALSVINSVPTIIPAEKECKE